MKTTLNKMTGKVAFLGMILAAADVAMAQTSSMTTTTTSAGTVREFTPNTFTVAATTSPAPVRYTYSKSTTYVDENGNPVAMETVRSGLPVTVYYDREGDQMMATKVVVRKSVDTSSDGTTSSQTTTTTSSQGLVSSFTPDSAIAVKTDTSPAPVNYTFTKTTTYVDQNGNPVSAETVRSGMPVTVYYDRNGDQMIANRVVVQTDPNAPVIVSKKTTTTTTETNPNP